MQYGPVFLTERLWFPRQEAADSDGLLAVGGDLSTERLLLAYRMGIFPWYDGPLPLWWCPDPRLVLFPEKIYVSKSMQQVLRRGTFTFTQNACFRQVMEACGTTPRQGQNGGTWVTPALVDAYEILHHMGHVHSFEAWQDGQLVGGLYGMQVGPVFCGESMFAKVSNASKAAFIWCVRRLQQQGTRLIDCQVQTPHLMSLGAELMPRARFLEWLPQG